MAATLTSRCSLLISFALVSCVENQTSGPFFAWWIKE
ncbi:hypothetical protein GLYMA_02G287802v4 [Glycine max]|nr:hypothetical protein GLYMA_02G287802v4 [Glycine max]KAH1062629.1 hypothetical protein GYH30_005538 [Glycine max]